MSFLCRLIGHKWLTKVKKEFTRDGEPWVRSYLEVHSYCLRCGAPNPGSRHIQHAAKQRAGG